MSLGEYVKRLFSVTPQERKAIHWINKICRSEQQAGASRRMAVFKTAIELIMTGEMLSGNYSLIHTRHNLWLFFKVVNRNA